MQEVRRIGPRVVIMGLLCHLLGFGVGVTMAASRQTIVVNVTPGGSAPAAFEAIHDLAEAKATDRLGLGVAAIFSYLGQPRERCQAQLTEFLSLAQRHEIPIVIQLDGEQWWGARPDLWNWWDPSRPGYDPENRSNVEWSGWGPEYAIKIAWRNWGRQIRVLPPPNFMSRPYRRACHEEMRVLVPLILDWWRHLPATQKHLLIGIKLGWESALGVNSFYYPDGNALLDRPESEDPQSGLKTDRLPDRGVATIGYAAVTTAGLASEGHLQEAHQVEIVRRHLEDLCALAAELGVPREKLFTHVAGWKEQELLYDAAVNRHSCPGWSFYHYASDPGKDKGVRRALEASDAPYWAAVEWLLMGQHDSHSWREAIERTLADPRCRYMCIYNWRDIKANPDAQQAIEGLLRAP